MQEAVPAAAAEPVAEEPAAPKESAEEAAAAAPVVQTHAQPQEEVTAEPVEALAGASLQAGCRRA